MVKIASGDTSRQARQAAQLAANQTAYQGFVETTARGGDPKSIAVLESQGRVFSYDYYGRPTDITLQRGGYTSSASLDPRSVVFTPVGEGGGIVAPRQQPQRPPVPAPQQSYQVYQQTAENQRPIIVQRRLDAIRAYQENVKAEKTRADQRKQELDQQRKPLDEQLTNINAQITAIGSAPLPGGNLPYKKVWRQQRSADSERKAQINPLVGQRDALTAQINTITSEQSSLEKRNKEIDDSVKFFEEQADVIKQEETARLGQTFKRAGAEVARNRAVASQYIMPSGRANQDIDSFGTAEKAGAILLQNDRVENPAKAVFGARASIKSVQPPLHYRELKGTDVTADELLGQKDPARNLEVIQRQLFSDVTNAPNAMDAFTKQRQGRETKGLGTPNKYIQSSTGQTYVTDVFADGGKSFYGQNAARIEQEKRLYGVGRGKSEFRGTGFEGLMLVEGDRSQSAIEKQIAYQESIQRRQKEPVPVQAVFVEQTPSPVSVAVEQRPTTQFITTEKASMPVTPVSFDTSFASASFTPPPKPKQFTQEEVNKMSPKEFTQYKESIDTYNAFVTDYNQSVRTKNKERQAELKADIARLENLGVKEINILDSKGNLIRTTSIENARFNILKAKETDKEIQLEYYLPEKKPVYLTGERFDTRTEKSPYGLDQRIVDGKLQREPFGEFSKGVTDMAQNYYVAGQGLLDLALTGGKRGKEIEAQGRETLTGNLIAAVNPTDDQKITLGYVQERFWKNPARQTGSIMDLPVQFLIGAKGFGRSSGAQKPATTAPRTEPVVPAGQKYYRPTNMYREQISPEVFTQDTVLAGFTKQTIKMGSGQAKMPKGYEKQLGTLNRPVDEAPGYNPAENIPRQSRGGVRYGELFGRDKSVYGFEETNVGLGRGIGRNLGEGGGKPPSGSSGKPSDGSGFGTLRFDERQGRFVSRRPDFGKTRTDKVPETLRFTETKETPFKSTRVNLGSGKASNVQYRDSSQILDDFNKQVSQIPQRPGRNAPLPEYKPTQSPEGQLSKTGQILLQEEKALTSEKIELGKAQLKKIKKKKRPTETTAAIGAGYPDSRDYLSWQTELTRGETVYYTEALRYPVLTEQEILPGITQTYSQKSPLAGLEILRERSKLGSRFNQPQVFKWQFEQRQKQKQKQDQLFQPQFVYVLDFGQAQPQKQRQKQGYPFPTPTTYRWPYPEPEIMRTPEPLLEIPPGKPPTTELLVPPIVPPELPKGWPRGKKSRNPLGLNNRFWNVKEDEVLGFGKGGADVFRDTGYSEADPFKQNGQQPNIKQFTKMFRSGGRKSKKKKKDDLGSIGF